VNVSNNILTRVYILFGLFVLGAVLILGRVAAIQLNKNYWLKKEVESRVFFKKVVADRGNILAEDGTIMATSLPFYRLAVDATVLDTTSEGMPAWRDSVFTLACLLFDRFGEEDTDTMTYYNRLHDAIVSGDRHVYLRRKLLSFKDLEEVKTWPILSLNRYKGGFIPEKIHNKRHYPYEEMGRITLGRMVNDTVGIRGIEASYNTELRGRDGYILAQKIRGGGAMPLDKYGAQEAQNGYDIRTTFDVNMQDIVSRALEQGVLRHQAKAGTAILMETKTGKIKALANYPETYNHGVAYLYEPGSTFKLFSAAALLEDSLVDVCDTIDTGNGRLEVDDDKEITDVGRYGKMTFERCFAKSSNVCLAMAVQEKYNYPGGAERFVWQLERMGLHRPANDQLRGEPAPSYHKPDDKTIWTSASLPSLAIGYSVQVTPLQMATAFNTVANGGVRMRPWMVSEIRDGGKIIEQFGPEKALSKPLKASTVNRMHEMMQQVVMYGTARNLADADVRIAGKTGTARKTQGGRYVKKYTASFGGFFPANDPAYTLFIMVDEPSQGSYYGGDVAAPIFKNIANNIYRYDWNLAKPRPKEHNRPLKQPAARAVYTQHAATVYENLGIETSTTPSTAFAKTATNGHQVSYAPIDFEDQVSVPNLRGMSARDAVNMLENMGVSVKLEGHGRVKRQSLLPGYRIGKGTKIKLFLG
jgi:cell division protein FtsI (penicillin-binding protein 3)